MEKEVQQRNMRTAEIRVADYLAKYARQKFGVHPKTGGIVIPETFNLYHCIWQVMTKRRMVRDGLGFLRPAEYPTGNLRIHLPNRCGSGTLWKDTRYWNHITPRAAHAISRELKRLFDWEFHHYVENLLENSPTATKVEAVRRFAQKYALGIDAEDALLKNYQRHERQERIFLGLRKSNSGLKKVKSTPILNTILSSQIPPLLRLPDRPDDQFHLLRRESALAGMIADGLQLLDESGVVGDPSL